MRQDTDFAMLRSRSPVMIVESDDDNDDDEQLIARQRGRTKQVVEDDSDE